MKLLSCFFVLLIFALSCSNHKAIFDQWKELNEFHEVMSQTFHPSEEGDLEPIKSRAVEMQAKAGILAQSKVPSKFDNPKMKETLEKLKTDSQNLANMVSSNASDDQITTSLAALHEVFHDIIMLCQDKAG